MISHTEVRQRLRALIDRYPERKIAADTLGLSLGVMYDVLSGRKEPTQYMLSLIGVRKWRVTVYQEADETPLLPCGAQVRTHNDRGTGAMRKQ